MVRRLRRKFVMTAMGALLIMLVLLVGFLNIFYLVEINRDAGTMLQMLLDHGGVFPVEEFLPIPPEEAEENRDGQEAGDEGAGHDQPPRGFLDYENIYRVEAPFETRYFSILVHGERVDTVDIEHVAAVTETQAQNYAVRIVSDGRESGYYGTYKFGTVPHEDGSVLVVFVDCSSRFSSAWELFRMTLIICGAAFVMMLVIVYLLSGLAVAPVAQSLAKQKRFISDAGHELKTPLSVISANVDVLEIDGERNEWTQSIRNQVRRMTDLVNNMLTLSRMEEGGAGQLYTEVDLSQCIRESTQTYAVVAVARDHQYEVTIQPGIHMMGDSKALTQLSVILLDNAMKYSNAGGSVRVRLSLEDKGIVYEVRNTCDEIPEGDLERLFDRFYRADSSRSRESGGYGIGLSVAKAICENHGGVIRALREDPNVICFSVRFPAGRVMN